MDEWIVSWLDWVCMPFSRLFCGWQQQLQLCIFSIFNLWSSVSVGFLHWQPCWSCCSCCSCWLPMGYWDVAPLSHRSTSVCNNLSNVPIWLLCWRIVSSMLDHVDFFLRFSSCGLSMTMQHETIRVETRCNEKRQDFSPLPYNFHTIASLTCPIYLFCISAV